jgi:hypothetical protein
MQEYFGAINDCSIGLWKGKSLLDFFWTGVKVSHLQLMFWSRCN